MATTNLNRQTLGEMEVQSGNGTPNHVGVYGSIYTDIDSGTTYVNMSNSSTGWTEMVKSVYGEVYIFNNTATNTTMTTQNTWYTVRPSAWSSGNLNGVTGTASGITIKIAGNYYVYTLLTAVRTSTNSCEIGISVNSANPNSGLTNAFTLAPASLSVPAIGSINLNVNDVVTMSVRCTSAAATTLRALHAKIFLQRTSDKV